MSDVEAITRRLRMAVHSPEEMHDPAAADKDLDQLLWEVGAMRRQISEAHTKLDLLGGPREDAGGGKLTLYGRIDRLVDETLLRAGL